MASSNKTWLFLSQDNSINQALSKQRPARYDVLYIGGFGQEQINQNACNVKKYVLNWRQR